MRGSKVAKATVGIGENMGCCGRAALSTAPPTVTRDMLLPTDNAPGSPRRPSPLGSLRAHCSNGVPPKANVVGSLPFLGRQILLFDRGHDHIVGIDHFGEVDLGHLRELLVGVISLL